jgi:membrane-associated phospholipid phosphatase
VAGARRRLVVALVVLATATLVVADQRFVRGEVDVVAAANALPRVVGAPLEVVMQLGTLLVGLAVAAVTAVLTRRRGPVPALTVLLAAAVAWRLDNVLKAIIDRPRPPGLVDDLVVREAATGFGFPSGHTTMAFALAAALHPTLPARWRWAAWALATLTGVSRMYVGVHWPMDLVGGAALGTAIGSAAVLVTSRYGPRPG